MVDILCAKIGGTIPDVRDRSLKTLASKVRSKIVSPADVAMDPEFPRFILHWINDRQAEVPSSLLKLAFELLGIVARGGEQQKMIDCGTVVFLEDFLEHNAHYCADIQPIMDALLSLPSPSASHPTQSSTTAISSSQNPILRQRMRSSPRPATAHLNMPHASSSSSPTHSPVTQDFVVKIPRSDEKAIFDLAVRIQYERGGSMAALQELDRWLDDISNCGYFVQRPQVVETLCEMLHVDGVPRAYCSQTLDFFYNLLRRLLQSKDLPQYANVDEAWFSRLTVGMVDAIFRFIIHRREFLPIVIDIVQLCLQLAPNAPLDLKSLSECVRHHFRGAHQEVDDISTAAQWFGLSVAPCHLPAPLRTYDWDGNHLLLIDLFMLLHRQIPDLAFFEHCIFDYRLRIERPGCVDVFRQHVSEDINREYSIFVGLSAGHAESLLGARIDSLSRRLYLALLDPPVDMASEAFPIIADCWNASDDALWEMARTIALRLALCPAPAAQSRFWDYLDGAPTALLADLVADASFVRDIACYGPMRSRAFLRDRVLVPECHRTFLELLFPDEYPATTLLSHLRRLFLKDPVARRNAAFIIWQDANAQLASGGEYCVDPIVQDAEDPHSLRRYCVANLTCAVVDIGHTLHLIANQDVPDEVRAKAGAQLCIFVGSTSFTQTADGECVGTTLVRLIMESAEPTVLIELMRALTIFLLRHPEQIADCSTAVCDRMVRFVCAMVTTEHPKLRVCAVQLIAVVAFSPLDTFGAEYGESCNPNPNPNPILHIPPWLEEVYRFPFAVEVRYPGPPAAMQFWNNAPSARTLALFQVESLTKKDASMPSVVYNNIDLARPWEEVVATVDAYRTYAFIESIFRDTAYRARLTLALSGPSLRNFHAFIGALQHFGTLFLSAPHAATTNELATAFRDSVCPFVFDLNVADCDAQEIIVAFLKATVRILHHSHEQRFSAGFGALRSDWEQFFCRLCAVQGLQTAHRYALMVSAMLKLHGEEWIRTLGDMLSRICVTNTLRGSFDLKLILWHQPAVEYKGFIHHADPIVEALVWRALAGKPVGEMMTQRACKALLNPSSDVVTEALDCVRGILDSGSSAEILAIVREQDVVSSVLARALQHPSLRQRRAAITFLQTLCRCDPTVFDVLTHMNLWSVLVCSACSKSEVGTMDYVSLGAEVGTLVAAAMSHGRQLDHVLLTTPLLDVLMGSINGYPKDGTTCAKLCSIIQKFATLDSPLENVTLFLGSQPVAWFILSCVGTETHRLAMDALAALCLSTCHNPSAQAPHVSVLEALTRIVCAHFFEEPNANVINLFQAHDVACVIALQCGFLAAIENELVPKRAGFLGEGRSTRTESSDITHHRQTSRTLLLLRIVTALVAPDTYRDMQTTVASLCKALWPAGMEVALNVLDLVRAMLTFDASFSVVLDGFVDTLMKFVQWEYATVTNAVYGKIMDVLSISAPGLTNKAKLLRFAGWALDTLKKPAPKDDGQKSVITLNFLAAVHTSKELEDLSGSPVTSVGPEWWLDELKSSLSANAERRARSVVAVILSITLSKKAVSKVFFAASPRLIPTLLLCADTFPESLNIQSVIGRLFNVLLDQSQRMLGDDARPLDVDQLSKVVQRAKSAISCDTKLANRA